MDQQIKEYIEQHECGVAEIMRQIEEAKGKLNSGLIINPVIRDAYEKLIIAQERQLEIVIKNHNMILELNGMGV